MRRARERAPVAGTIVVLVAVAAAACATTDRRPITSLEASVLLSEEEAALYRQRLLVRGPSPLRPPPTPDGLLTGVTYLYDPLTGGRALVDGGVRSVGDGRFEVRGPAQYVIELRDDMVWVGMPIAGARTPFFDAFGNVRLLRPAEVVRPWSPTGGPAGAAEDSK